MEISVRTKVGERCITQEVGQRVYEMIHPVLAKGQHVGLDFTGVEVFASPFFNAAIGQLLRDISAADLNKHLSIEGLIPEGKLVLRRVIQNAKEYYSNPDAKKAIEDILLGFPTKPS